MENKIEELFKASFINIDKPSGPTSFDVVDIIRKMMNVSKTSHSGTLDPKVTGVLVVGIGRAARLLRFFPSDKEYVGVMHLHEEVSEDKIKEAIKSEFLGKIKQIPPKRSAVKRAEREREIYSFEILEVKGKDVLFKVHCEAGTYIRKLCHDLGEKLKGGHMLELRRTRAGAFPESESITLYQLQEAFDKYKQGDAAELEKHLQPIELLTGFIPSFELKDDSIKRILTGSPVFKGFLKDEEKIGDLKIGIFIALTHNSKLVGVARIVHEGTTIAVPEVVLN